MGHVPTGPVPQERQGDELSRREHRGARAPTLPLSRPSVARLGEDLAASFLISRGAAVLGRNLRHGRGEIDLLVELGGVVVAVEVKTARRGDIDPADNFTADKARMVRRTAARLDPPARRIDLITVIVDAHGVAMRWVKDAA